MRIRRSSPLSLLLRFWIICGFLPTGLFAQREVMQWYFGDSAGLDFTCDPPEPLVSKQLSSIEGTSSISDSAGSLLFYTDGYRVWDRTHAVMANGTDIGQSVNCGGSSTQGAMIVKQPGQDSLYYIFTTDCAENLLSEGFNYSIVNMSQNGGLGAVVVKKQQLVRKTCEKLAAMRHSDGNRVWILTHEWGNAQFMAYLLGPGGLDTVPVISICGRVQLPPPGPDPPEYAARGYFKFSPQGDRIVVFTTSDSPPYFQSYPEVFSYDRGTGQVTYDYIIDTQDNKVYYGGTFSPNGQLLYASCGWYGFGIDQFDLSSNQPAAVAASRYTVQNISTSAAMQIGPNGKIYAATYQHFLDVIHSPNTLGAGCNYQANGQELTRCMLSHSRHGLPNHDESFYASVQTGVACPQRRLVDFSSRDSCAGTPVQFHTGTTLNTWYPVRWNFGDPGSGAQNTSTAFHPTHTYSTPGTYAVTFVAYRLLPGECILDSIVRPLTIVSCASTGVEGAQTAPVKLSPNPTVDRLKIESPFPIQRVVFTDLQGRRVHAVEEPDLQQVDFDLPSGVYLVRLTGAHGLILHRKILVEAW
jgi:hypothetical protein